MAVLTQARLSRPGAAMFAAANRHDGGLTPAPDDFRRLVAQVTPKRVECGNDKMVVTTQPRAVALHGFTHYRSDTDTWLPVLVLDTDDRDPFDLVMAGRPIPFPTWLTYNNANGHSHAVYALAEPVTQGPRGRRGPQHLAALAHDALALRLEADQAHRNTVTRTPWHQGHTFQPLLLKRWHLQELLALLPQEAQEVSRRTQQAGLAAGKALETAKGRNDHLYLMTVRWAMDEARAGRWAGLTLAVIEATAWRLNTYSPPLPAGEVRSIARSALGFMQKDWWGNRSTTPGQGGQGSPRERLKSWQRDPITPQEARQRQQAAGAATAAGRTEATRAAIKLAAENIRKTGQTPTRRLLMAVTGLSEKTVKRHSDLYR